MACLRYNCNVNIIVEKLIAAGTDVNDQDNEGWTALMYALEYEYQEDQDQESSAVEALLKAGANVDDQTDEGFTVLDFVRQSDIIGIIDIIDTASAADALVLNKEIPKFLSEHNDLFFARASHAISKNLDIAQYNRLIAYCAEHNLELPEESAKKIADSFAARLFDNLTQEYSIDPIDFNDLDNAMVKRIFEAFKAQAREEIINDYDTVVGSLNPAFVPKFLVDNITKLMQSAKESLDDFESIVRGEIEGISIMPARLVTKGIDTEDEYYQTDENTIAYYAQHPEELNYPGAYFSRMDSDRLIEVMSKLDPTVVDAILVGCNNKNIMPYYVHKILQEIKSHYDSCSVMEEVALAGNDMSSIVASIMTYTSHEAREDYQPKSKRQKLNEFESIVVEQELVGAVSDIDASGI